MTPPKKGGIDDSRGGSLRKETLEIAAEDLTVLKHRAKWQTWTQLEYEAGLSKRKESLTDNKIIFNTGNKNYNIYTKRKTNK